MKPVDREWVASGILRTSAKREVHAGPHQVWDLLADATRWSEWHESLSMFEVTDGSDLGPNATFRSKEWVFRNEGTITEWEPGQAIGFTLTASTFSPVFAKYGERVEITPGSSDNHCTIVHSGRISPAPFGWLFAGYVLGQALGAMYFDYHGSVRNLARLAEADH